MAIYFVECGEGGPIKIGHARQVKNRIDILQTGCPYKLRLIAEVDIDHKHIEGSIHRKFKEYNIHGEWFERSKKLLDFIEFIKKNGAI